MGLLSEMKRSRTKSKLMANLIDSMDINNPNRELINNDEAFESFYTFISEDIKLGPVIKAHKVSKDEIHEYMDRLSGIGYGWIKNKSSFLPVSAFSFCQPLDYVLTEIENDTDIGMVAYNLKNLL